MTEAPPPPRDESLFAEWLRRKRGHTGLLLSSSYRRDSMALMLANIRALITARSLLAILILAIAAVAATIRLVEIPSQGYIALSGAFAVAAVLAGATMFTAERQAGTFELLWLATGSEKGLMRLKIGSVMALLLALMIPAVIIMSAYFGGGGFSTGKTVFSLAINTLLVLAIMTFSSSLLPQAWAGGLAGAAIVATCWFALLKSDHVFNPFLNPYRFPAEWYPPERLFRPGMPLEAKVTINRILYLAFSLFLLSSASKRLRKAFA